MAKYERDFTSGKLLMPCLLMAFPIFLTNFLQILYNAADMIVVGRLVGDTALAAVGATSQLTNLLMNLVFGIATAVNVICAKYYGAKNFEDLKKSTHTSVLFAIILGVIIGIIGVLAAKPLLVLTNTPEGEVLEEATTYMQIYFAGVPFAVLYNFGAAILRSIGDSKRPMYILAFSGIANVILNLFCVMVLKIGVAGVAIGTVASEIISVICIFAILLKTDSCIHVDIKKICLDKYIVKELLRMGVPAGLNGMTYSISNVVIQSSINALGKTVIAAATAASNLSHVSDSWGTAVFNVTLCASGQNMGAKKYSRIKKLFWISIGISSVGKLAYGGMLLYAPIRIALLSLFSADAEIFKFATIKILTETCLYFLLDPSTQSVGIMRGMGIATTPTIVNILCICIPRIIWMITVYRIFEGNLYVLFACYPISWLIASIVNTAVLKIKQKKLFDPNDEIPDNA